MSRHSGPHFRVPADDQRCEALVPAHPSYHFEWMRTAHRCPRRASQMRDHIAVCYQHASAKTLRRYE